MRKWTKASSLLFLAASAVYSGQAALAGSANPAIPAGPGTPGTDVKLLEDGADVFAAAPATKPANEGQSVSQTQVNVSAGGTVEIHVNDASLVEVLRMLSLQSQRNIVASKDVHGTVTANLYDVTVQEALDAILRANGYGYREKGNFVYVYTAKELAEMDKAERHMTTEVFRLYYTPASNAVTMIKPVLSLESQTSLTTPALAGTASKEGGNSHATEDMLVVTDYPENLDRVRKILKEVDHRPQQILIEATILSAALTEDNALGVDFTVMGGVDFSTLTESGSNTNEALSGTIVDNPTAGGIVNNGYNATGTGFTKGVPPGGLRMGLVTKNISVFLSALEQVTDTVVLANPKVLALNKQTGEVIVGRKDGYLTTTVTQSSTVQTVDFLETGTRLVFRPYIGDDGYIRMEIHPEDSSGGLNDANLPFKITTEVTSNIMVRDGHTIVIGGLFREDSATTRGQVPFLGNIPLAGNLFRRQRDRTTRQEVIILLTPHIVKDEAAYTTASEAELKDAEKLRVGLRQGMMPFGRERLAEWNYEKARAEMAKSTPDRQKALWHLNCATNLNPKFIEAITLKESVTGQEVTAVDNSTIRAFVRRQILIDKAPLPATQPAENANPAKPTTGPVAHAEPATPPVAAAPATQPFAVAATTQPAESESTLTAPVSVSDGCATESKQDTRVVAEPAPATTQPLSEQSESPAVTVVELPVEPAVPTTRPAQAETSRSATTVTELPMDEVAPSPSVSVPSK